MIRSEASSPVATTAAYLFPPAMNFSTRRASLGSTLPMVLRAELTTFKVSPAATSSTWSPGATSAGSNPFSRTTLASADFPISSTNRLMSTAAWPLGRSAFSSISASSRLTFLMAMALRGFSSRVAR